MPEKYQTAHFVLGESSPQAEPQKTLSEIVFMVKARLADALADNDVGLAGEDPRVIISMVVTNILVNLMFHSISASDVKRRLAMVEDSLNEIHNMTYELWNALEANRADMSTPH